MGKFHTEYTDMITRLSNKYTLNFLVEFIVYLNKNWRLANRLNLTKGPDMRAFTLLEKMANTPCLENEVYEIVKKNKFLKTALETNNAAAIKKRFSPDEQFANEVLVVCS